MTEHEHHLGEDLAAFAEGTDELSRARRAELEAHVASCPACRDAVASARAVFEAVDALPRPEPGPSFERSLMQRLDAIDAQASEPTLLDRARAFFTIPRLAFVGAAMAAAMVLVSITRSPPAPTPGETVAEAVPIDDAMEMMELAENLELLENYDVVVHLDVLDDLRVIETLELGEAG